MIAIVDYGLGNVKAFANVYKKLNIPCYLAETPEKLQKAKKIILPGVGAFDHAITKLNESGMRDVLQIMVVENEVPVLGVCVGMQIMAKSSEEGHLEGLGWFQGDVRKFKFSDPKYKKLYPLPHMGWNNVNIHASNLLFKDFEQSPEFYFLHSFYFYNKNQDISIGCTNYGIDFCCAVNEKHIFGIQCHPEKSHRNGVRLLKNFAEL